MGMQIVSAAKNKIILPGYIYVYNHNGKRTQKVYKKRKRLSYTSIKKINGQKYYRIGKNKYIHLYDAFLIEANNYQKSNKNDPAKNAANLMDFIAMTLH